MHTKSKINLHEDTKSIYMKTQMTRRYLRN